MNQQNTVPEYAIRRLNIVGWRDMSHALEALWQNGQPRQGTLIAINAEKVLVAEENPVIRALITDAEFKYADGISIVRGIRRKYPGAAISRVAGADLWKL